MSFLQYLTCVLHPKHEASDSVFGLVSERRVNNRCVSVQAEKNVENLNKLQTILGMEARPDLKELRKPENLHTKKHLTAWFDEWIQLYELLPLIIHPDSTEAGSSESEDSADSADSADAEGEEAAAAEAEEAAADAVEAEEEKKSDSEGGNKKKKGGKKVPEGDGRVMLTKEQVDEVLHHPVYDPLLLLPYAWLVCMYVSVKSILGILAEHAGLECVKTGKKMTLEVFAGGDAAQCTDESRKRRSETDCMP